MDATSLGNEIIDVLREWEYPPDFDIQERDIQADDKTPPDAFPAIRVSYLGILEIAPVKLREQPANDPANISSYTYRFNIRVVAEEYATDGDGYFKPEAAPGRAEHIRALPQVMFARDSRRRITWKDETAGEYEGEETTPRPYVDMTISIEVMRGI